MPSWCAQGLIHYQSTHKALNTMHTCTTCYSPLFQPLSDRNYNDIKVYMRFHYCSFTELKVNTIFLSTTVNGRPPPQHTLPFLPSDDQKDGRNML
jgi:hypothetical protein